MNDLNNVTLTGRLTRDALMKYSTDGLAMCKFSIAVNRRKRQEGSDVYTDDAHFFDIVIWGRMGESLHKFLIKGKPVGIAGELRQYRYQKDDGSRQSRVEIHAHHVKLLDSNTNHNYADAQEETDEDVPF
ncbi:MAG: single-stranded DNA-binding protein [Treponema sp.]|nr:single-stranded DNA-binding protein [Treponema sp.]